MVDPAKHSNQSRRQINNAAAPVQHPSENDDGGFFIPYDTLLCQGPVLIGTMGKGYPAIGKIKAVNLDNLTPSDEKIEQSQIKVQIDALKRTTKEVGDLFITKSMTHPHGSSERNLLSAASLIIQDPGVIDRARNMIRDDLLTAARAYYQACEAYLTNFTNPRLERLLPDIKGARNEIIAHLTDTNALPDWLENPSEPIILVGDEIPFHWVNRGADSGMLYGVVTSAGSLCHACVTAGARNIPWVAKVDRRGRSWKDLESYPLAIIDPDRKLLFVGPSRETLADGRYSTIRDRSPVRSLEPKGKSITIDDVPVSIRCNIDGVRDFPGCEQVRPDGIGLFRTEASFLEGSMRTEDKHKSTYLTLSKAIPGTPFTIRAIDFHGDKRIETAVQRSFVPGVHADTELYYKEHILRPQIRGFIAAFCDASDSTMQLLFPMIESWGQFVDLKTVVASEMLLIARERQFDPMVASKLKDCKIGAMIESPAAVDASRLIAGGITNKDSIQMSKEALETVYNASSHMVNYKQIPLSFRELLMSVTHRGADFLSIGTNDLTAGISRRSRSEADISVQPILLKFLDQVAQVGKDCHKEVGLCGDMASVPALAPLLIGLDVSYLSTTLTAARDVAEVISKVKKKDCLKLFKQLKDEPDEHAVVEGLRQFNTTRGLPKFH